MMTHTRKPRLGLLGSLFLLVCLSTTGQEMRDGEHAEPPVPAVIIPTDLDDCLVQLERILAPEDVQAIRDGSEADLIRYHHGLGTWLRNNWGLWGGSRLSEWFNDRGIHHPDDMSGIILTSFWRQRIGIPTASRVAGGLKPGFGLPAVTGKTLRGRAAGWSNGAAAR